MMFRNLLALSVEATPGQLIGDKVTAEVEGYLTLLNVGAQGKVDRFLPEKPQTTHRSTPG